MAPDRIVAALAVAVFYVVATFTVDAAWPAWYWILIWFWISIAASYLIYPPERKNKK